MSEELKNCSHCQKGLHSEGMKYIHLSINKQSFYCCESCWEKNKETYKKQIKSEWDKLEEWEKKEKYNNHISCYASLWRIDVGHSASTHDLLEGLFCEECDKWCDKKGGGRSSFSDGIFSFCSSEHRFIITEKNELKHLQEQWKFLKDFPENYPTRAETKKRLEELERKYSNSNNNPSREREREQKNTTETEIKQYFQSHNIKSITLKDQELIIEYNQGTNQTFSVNTPELQQIQAYCQTKGVNSLTFSDLEQSTQSPSGFNWKSPWVIGGGVVLVVGVIGLVLYLVNRNKKE